MTPERTKELLPIITAFANGETIQWRRNWGANPTEWADYTNDSSPTWDSLVIWRIKPKVPEYRLFMYSDGSIGVFFRNINHSWSVPGLQIVEEAARCGGRWLTDWLPIPNYNG